MKTPIQHQNPVTKDRLNKIRETILHNQELLAELNNYVEGAKQMLVVVKKEKNDDMIKNIEAEIRLYQPSIRYIRKVNGELMTLIHTAGKWEGYEMTGNEYEGLVFQHPKGDNKNAPNDFIQNFGEPGKLSDDTPKLSNEHDPEKRLDIPNADVV